MKALLAQIFLPRLSMTVIMKKNTKPFLRAPLNPVNVSLMVPGVISLPYPSLRGLRFEMT